MRKTGLGIDTGGTYTDGVVADLETGEILARSKSLTTRNDLSIGISGAIGGFDGDLLRGVSTVSLSSTLATNSIVEGKGCRVALVLMGSDLSVDVKVDHVARIAGSHTPSGDVDEPLDEEAAERFLRSVAGKVDCVAVSGFMSVRNPAFEKRVAAMAREILGVPAVCGHELSSSLGFNERAVTCVMNARLIPVIEELLDSVDRVLDEYGIRAPLMIVKGDGSVMGREVARERPVETILSGPASSVTGAMRLTGLRDAVVVDVGGTTTDIGVVRGGEPRLNPEGASIGGYRTRVMAAEISTAGIGGDSRVVVNGPDVSLSSLRVTPLCVASHQHPSLKARLRDLAASGPVRVARVHYVHNIVMDTEFFVKLKDVGDDPSFTDLDRRFLEYVDGEPRSLREARRDLKELPISINVQALEERGFIQRIGLTPTDFMHFRGVFTAYDAEASVLGIRYHAANLGTTPEGLADLVESLVADRIGREIAEKAVFEDLGRGGDDGFGADLLMKAVRNEPGLDYDVRIRLNKPIVGLGAPSYDMLPKVAERLGAELVIPENYDVGNAVGAVNGKVSESIEILVQPTTGTRLSDPACKVFSRLGRRYFDSYAEGLRRAEEEGRRYVAEAAAKAGAGDVEVTVERRESSVQVGVEYFQDTISEVTLVIRAVGDPRPLERAHALRRGGRVGRPGRAPGARLGRRHEEVRRHPLPGVGRGNRRVRRPQPPDHGDGHGVDVRGRGVRHVDGHRDGVRHGRRLLPLPREGGGAEGAPGVRDTGGGRGPRAVHRRRTMNRGWAWILAGGVAETVWATFMKLSDGFTDLWWDVPMLVFMFVSVWMLNRGFRSGLPTGPGYAAWVGIGAVGSVVVGVLLFGDVLNLGGWLCLALVIGGVVGLNLVTEDAVGGRGRSGRGRLSRRRRGRRTRPWAPGSSGRSSRRTSCPGGPSGSPSRTATPPCPP